MNIEQERAEFEAWYRLHHGSRDVYGRDASGEYADKQVQGAFSVWQARAAMIDLADDIRAALAAQPAASAEHATCNLQLATQAPAADGDALDAARYRWLRDPCSGAERVIFYCRGDYGRGLMSGAMLDAAIDATLAASTGQDVKP